MEPVYGFRSLLAFKAKFQPRLPAAVAGVPERGRPPADRPRDLRGVPAARVRGPGRPAGPGDGRRPPDASRPTPEPALRCPTLPSRKANVRPGAHSGRRCALDAHSLAVSTDPGGRPPPRDGGDRSAWAQWHMISLTSSGRTASPERSTWTARADRHTVSAWVKRRALAAPVPGRRRPSRPMGASGRRAPWRPSWRQDGVPEPSPPHWRPGGCSPRTERSTSRYPPDDERCEGQDSPCIARGRCPPIGSARFPVTLLPRALVDAWGGRAASGSASTATASGPARRSSTRCATVG